MASSHLERLAAFGILAGLISSAGHSVYAQESAGADSLAAADRASVAGEWLAAEDLYREALDQDANNVDALEGLGFILAEQGRLEEAIAAYRDAVQLAPREPRLLYSLAAVVDRAEPRRALSLWTRYVGLARADPHERGYIALARERIRQLAGR